MSNTFVYHCIHKEVAKKEPPPHQKWLTWFIMTIGKENVDKSCVFVLA